MATHSGRYGAVLIGDDKVIGVGQWDITATVPEGTVGKTVYSQKGSTTNGSFTVTAPLPPVYDGMEFLFRGFCGPDDGGPTGIGDLYEVPAIVSNVSISPNWTTGEPIVWTIAFVSNGDLVHSKADQQGYAGETYAFLDPDFSIEIIGHESDECLNITDANLSIDYGVTQIATPCSGEWSMAVRGGETATLTMNVMSSNFEDVPALGSFVDIRIYLSGASEDTEGNPIPAYYIDIKRLHINSKGSMVTNISTGDFVTFPVGMTWSPDGSIVISNGNTANDIVLAGASPASGAYSLTKVPA